MADRTIQKAKAGAEDLLFGDGTVTQTRNATNIDITKINANKIPYSGDATTADVVTVKEQIDSNTNITAKKTVDTLADLIAVTSTERAIALYVNVAGFSSVGDGGGGLFYWSSSTNADTHDGGTIIDPSIGVTPGAATWWTPRVTTDTGVWVRTESKIVDVMVFGGIEGIVAGISTNSITGVVSTEQTLAADLTVPSNITLNIKNTGQIDGAFTLTVNGNIEAGIYQLFGSSVSVVFGNLCKDSIVPHWFDDSDTWNGVIRAINSMEAGTGGTLNFPSEIYNADTEVVISSLYPINLIGEMNYVKNVTTTTYGPYIRPASGISGSIFKYTAPDSGARSRHGAGTISNLTFLDDSDLSTTPVVDRRTVSITAAIELNDFDYGTVENCKFIYLKGSGIATGRSIKSNILNCVFELSGDTGKSALKMVSSDATNQTQAVNVSDCKFEANFSAPYITIGEDTGSIKVNNCVFEALATVSDPGDDSQQNYVYCLGDKPQIRGCQMNKNKGLFISIGSVASAVYPEYPILSDITMSGDNEDGRILWITDSGIISNIYIQGSTSDVGTAVTIGDASAIGISALTTINNLTVRNGGNLVVYASDCRLSNIQAIDMTTTESHAIKLMQNRSVIISSIVDGTEDDVGGILLDDAQCKAIGCHVRNIGTTGANTAHGIDTDAGTTSVINCDFGTINGTGMAIDIHNSGVVIADCSGQPSEAGGFETIANPDTTAVVTHGMVDTPDTIQLTAVNGDLPDGVHIWASAIGATTFQINITTTPAVSQTIGWYAKRVNT